MRQITLAHQAEFQRYSKKTRREQFLEEMDAVMSWGELLALVAPYYSKGEMGRKPVGLAIMLRVYFLQQWFALSDPGVEDALYESPVLRRFAGIDLGGAPVLDETTILNFRHLLEAHELCGQMLDAVNLYLASKGMPKGMPADASETHFRSEPATSVVNRNGVRLALTAFRIFAGDSRSGAAFWTGKQTPAAAANVVLLDGGGMVGMTGLRARKHEVGPIRLKFQVEQHAGKIRIQGQFVL